MNRQLFLSALVLLFLFFGTAIVVLYGRGYRFGFDSGRPDLAGTGILVTTSQPNGASVYINGHLTTATDNTINLAPSTYDVKIAKEGYRPWEKSIKVEKEAVSKAEALLFPTAPKLESITSLGANNPVADPSLTRIAYTVSSQSAKKNGLYILDTTQRPILTLQSSSTQIADDTFDRFSKAKIRWSPDGSEILADVGSTVYRLDTNKLNDNPKDVTETMSSVLSVWAKDSQDKTKARLDSLKPALALMIRENMAHLYWSADDTKVIYNASKSATLPFIIVPRLIGTNSTDEDRSIKENQPYIYDVAEDRNYKLNADSTHVQWLPDSKHLLFVHDKKIDVMEYDGTNQTTVYAGPFVDDSVFPSQSISKVVLLTNLGNSDIPPNLYTLSLK